MFDLNLINKPGLQAEKVDKTISYLKNNDNLKNRNSKSNHQKNQKSRSVMILISGVFFAVMSAIGSLYLLPIIKLKNDLEKPVVNKNITKNQVMTGLIDLLLNPEIGLKVSQVYFQKDIVSIFFKNLNIQQVKMLEESNFHGINIRTSINKLNQKYYLFKLPWKGKSNPNIIGLNDIKEKIGKRFVMSTSYDFTSDSFVMIIDEFKNIVSILLRLNDSNILENYEINIQSGPESFTTISLKSF